jgi:uncharacterized protein
LHCETRIHDTSYPSGGHRLAGPAWVSDRNRITARCWDGAAWAAGVPFLGLWLEAPLPVLEARISGRRHDASDATVDVLRAASRANPQAGEWVAVDASDAAVALEQARAAVRQRLGIRSLA